MAKKATKKVVKKRLSKEERHRELLEQIEEAWWAENTEFNRRLDLIRKAYPVGTILKNLDEGECMIFDHDQENLCLVWINTREVGHVHYTVIPTLYDEAAEQEGAA